MSDTKFSLYTLTIGENSYSSPTAMTGNEARRLQSLIPSLSGALERERPLSTLTADAPFPSQVGFFHQYKQNASGVFTYFYFCATATTLYRLVSGAWTAVTDVGTLAGYPVAVNINNQMHFTDGAKSWLFDGISWVKEGLAVPTHAPRFSKATPNAAVNITSISRVNGVVTATLASAPTINAGTFGTFQVSTGGYLTIAGVSDSTFNTTFKVVSQTIGNIYTFSQLGYPDSSPTGGTAVATSFNVNSNRYYWTSWVDRTVTHQHESSASPMSLGTGSISGGDVVVFLRPGSVTVGIGSTSVVGVATDFDQNDVGLSMFMPNETNPLVIASVADGQHLTLSSPTTATHSADQFVIAPARTTHFNVYCSATEEDKVGSLLSSIPITLIGLRNFYADQSPFLTSSGSYITNIQRPLLNDPPNPTKVMDVWKYRIWRRVENCPNFLSFTAYEEVLAELAGSPYESVPGIDPNTQSTGQVNQMSIPDQGIELTGIRKHGDALFLGTTENVVPMYGNNLSDFQLSEAQAFSVGFGGQRCTCSTPFGLAFLSWDLKVYLYPSQYSFGVDSTTALIELSRPKRPEFEQIDSTDLANVHMVFYNWGRRNWLVICYKRTDGTHSTWVFDFECKAWFQLQQGYTALYVFEFTAGRKTLVGAGTDNRIYVIDDLTGNYPVAPGATYPQGTLRFLINFGAPDEFFILRKIAYQVSAANMGVQVNLYLDPADPDNPTGGIPITMSRIKLGSNSYVGQPGLSPNPGSSCQRALVEIIVPSGTVNGNVFGITLEGDKFQATPPLASN